MSNTNQTIPTVPAEFQSSFSRSAETDVSAKRPDWERLCGDLHQLIRVELGIGIHCRCQAANEEQGRG